jgi:hypothetical protein
MTKPKKDLERAPLWPKPGQLIRHDITLKHIEPGETVIVTSFIARRIKQGDLFRNDPSPGKEPTQGKAKTKHVAESEG